MNEEIFWLIIDEAWQSSSRLEEFRAAVLTALDSGSHKESFEDKYGNDDPLIPDEGIFVSAIEDSLDRLSKFDLEKFDNILERKLFDIDRKEIHDSTDGSDDGFLYCRGFVVALGQKYYNAIDVNPALAMFDWSCEQMTYVSFRLYGEKFGNMAATGISRESYSNTDGWPKG